MEFKLKSHFKFRNNTGNMLFLMSRSNFYLVLLDENFKCVFSCSTGMAGIGRNKKQKMSTQNSWKVLDFFKPLFELYKIKYINFYLRSHVTGHLYAIIKHFEILNVKVIGYHKILNKAHNGVRKRKLRRV